MGQSVRAAPTPPPASPSGPQHLKPSIPNLRYPPQASPSNPNPPKLYQNPPKTHQKPQDLVNLKLDQHRNQLISLDLLLTAFTAACAVVNVVAGIFGMNLVSGLAEDAAAFSQVTYTAIGVSVLFYLCFVAFVWVKQLLTL